MSDQTLFMLSAKELTSALIRHHGIHSGIWTLAIEFELAAAQTASGKGGAVPAAQVAVHRIGISKTDKLHDMAADAAAANRQGRTGKLSAVD